MSRFTTARLRRKAQQRRFNKRGMNSSRRRLLAERLEDRQLLAAVTVNNNLDVVNGTTTSIASLIATPGADGISLREAIIAANNSSGADTIGFDSVFFATARTTNIGSQLPTITDSLTITGPGAALLTIDAGGGTTTSPGDGFRIFEITDGVDGNFIGVGISGQDLSWQHRSQDRSWPTKVHVRPE